MDLMQQKVLNSRFLVMINNLKKKKKVVWNLLPSVTGICNKLN